MKSYRSRLLLFIAFLCFASLGVALVSQHVFDMQPCAWCVMQRVIFLVIGLVALIGSIAGRVISRIAALLIVILGSLGIAAAWHQYTVASKSLSCAMTFADRFMNGLGFDAAAPWFFGIYASCAEATVSLFGVEYALGGLALFGVLALLALPAAFKRGA